MGRLPPRDHRQRGRRPRRRGLHHGHVLHLRGRSPRGRTQGAAAQAAGPDGRDGGPERRRPRLLRPRATLALLPPLSPLPGPAAAGARFDRARLYVPIWSFCGMAPVRLRTHDRSMSTVTGPVTGREWGMSPRRVVPAMTVMAVMAVLAALLAAPVSAAPSAKGGAGRYLVVARSAADLGGLRASAVRQGAKVLGEIPQIKAMVVSAPAGVRGSLAADRRAVGVARDRFQRVTEEDPASAPNLSKPGVLGGARVRLPAAAAAKAAAAGIHPDPAWDYKGLLWDYRRIGLPKGWNTTAGSGAVTVGVSDTGLDFTHAELAPKVKQVVDLTALEDPPLCKTLFGVSDDDLAAQFGGPAETDWYGHGSWIGGNIAAALDGKGVNSIAPKVNLVSLKIAQWCLYDTATTEIASFITAADLG